jgi:ring-1,2-phenylacetyl-CoA epoxidase subunit PaaD
MTVGTYRAEAAADLDSLAEEATFAALRSVDDPEYPGLSILDLGLVEDVAVQGATATIGLIPTFSGCPALHMIADDVVAAVEGRPEIDLCRVEWLPSPVWSTDRLTDLGRQRLAREYTVVIRSRDGSLRCPVCGSSAVTDQSLAGPSRCRSIAWCDDCRNPVEVMR